MLEKNRLYLGDNKEILRKIDDNSVDSIVTDPPYGIRFMNKKWDYQIPKVEFWQECLRVLKPGGHILVACGTRTHHRMTVNIEDAGFEIRDTIAWVYGSGFPKNYDIGKGVDKKMGNERKIVGDKIRIGDKKAYSTNRKTENHTSYSLKNEKQILTKGNSQYEGYGTALKPAMEFWTLARKPLSEKTIVDNVLKWGTGGINIDECRISIDNNDNIYAKNPHTDGTIGANGIYGKGKPVRYEIQKGRFPANFIHDGSDEVIENFPYTKSGKANGNAKKGESGNITPMRRGNPVSRNDDGSAARFFYCAKASKSERTHDGQVENKHPTVKPLKLMEYLVRLITPKNGVVLDPFAGSGSTLIAAYNLEFHYIGIEQDEQSYNTATERLKATKNNQ